ncbi:MAG: glycosyltransferase [Flavobacteriales bacterium]|nr:glycosyltransferase [Flavobacteriales bacterium]
MRPFEGKHILIIVENLPLPFDRRVWQEANTLKENGAKVSIICPVMKGYTKRHETLNGIDIYRHPLPFEADGAIGYLLEYSTALFWEWWLAWKVYFKHRFDIIHGCNPPDLIFLVALWFRLLGVKFVFDHHDINPELYIAKYNKKGVFYHLMMVLEKLTFLTASYSIATNESYKEIAIRRGGIDPDKVQVVRSGPKLERLSLINPIPKYKKGKRFLVGYVGVIGAQEGIDLLLESFKMLLEIRDDVQLAIIGDGTSLQPMKSYCDKLGIRDNVDFYGRVDDRTLIEVLNTSDICVNPDRPTEMNNLSTMNKIMEYMALKKPIVQFDLKEGKFSAREASLYAVDVNDFALKMNELLEYDERRAEMGNYGYERVVKELSWEHESQKLIAFYRRVFNLGPR